MVDIMHSYQEVACISVTYSGRRGGEGWVMIERMGWIFFSVSVSVSVSAVSVFLSLSLSSLLSVSLSLCLSVSLSWEWGDFSFFFGGV